MATSLHKAGYVMYVMLGGELSEEDYYAREVERIVRRRAEERQRLAAALRKARRAHGVQAGSLKPAAPAWQRRIEHSTRKPRSIEAAMQNPRIRGQLATRP